MNGSRRQNYTNDKSCVSSLHADRMRFFKVATSTVYTQQNWHNMMDNIVLNTNILRKVKETSIRGNTIEKWCKQQNTETWTRPLKNTLQLLVGRNTQSSISGKQFSRGIIWRHVWTTYLIFKIRTGQIDGEIPHQKQCLMVNRHTCQSVNTGRVPNHSSEQMMNSTETMKNDDYSVCHNAWMRRA